MSGGGRSLRVVPPFSQGGAIFPAVSEYLAILDKYQANTKPNFGSLEGYLATRVFVEILKGTGKNLTQESFTQTAESLRNLDIQAGNRISFSPENHQGSQIIYPTIIRNGAFMPVTDWHVVKTQ